MGLQICLPLGISLGKKSRASRFKILINNVFHFKNDVIAELCVILAYFHMACLTYFSDPNVDGRFLQLQVGQSRSQ